MTHTYLDTLEHQSISLLREAYACFGRRAILWSIGKDSNVLLWLARKAFLGHVPFDVLHIDTGLKFPEMYAFREQYARVWGLNLTCVLCPPLEDIEGYDDLTLQARSAARKSAGLARAINDGAFEALVVGIRRDEDRTRAKEQLVSLRFAMEKGDTWRPGVQGLEFRGLVNAQMGLRPPRNGHVRFHPLLFWREIDIWRYTQRENIPVLSLYFAKNGLRYRTLGDQNITQPVHSSASTLDDIINELEATNVPERSGRLMDRGPEHTIEKLRLHGYF